MSTVMKTDSRVFQNIRVWFGYFSTVVVIITTFKYKQMYNIFSSLGHQTHPSADHDEIATEQTVSILILTK